MTKLTIYWPPEKTDAGVREAAAAIASGGVVAFPTETVYGLGGDARNAEAVERIFAAKGRPSDNPLIVHLAGAEDAAKLASAISSLERRLMERFWPGPLTLVLPVRPGAVSARVTAGLDTVAVRVPDHELARRLIAESGCPIAAPSANRSGRPSPTRADHVLEDLDGRIDGVLDGGPTGIGLESTVVRVLDGAIHVLRPGGITAEQLREAAGGDAEVIAASAGEAAAAEAQPADAIAAAPAAGKLAGADAALAGAAANAVSASVEPADAAMAADADAGARAIPAAEEAPRSPGMKYTHYAPQGEMAVVTGADPARVREAVQQAADRERAGGRRVAVLACAEHAPGYRADAVLGLGSRAEPEQAAQALYAALRECDERGIGFILAEGYPEDGIGAALMNRMRKAAGGRVISV
ncbi:L-threonylcarbamoyladenylate synthase [Cohnella lubricantis]|uniref:Threonylcarbamoyl-AMP synthase n=1 Tax=Cohnella lubricantis TaxID=2163172 RepID=A0A841T605_9BACL|nr:L-threonylcarbamoyladenylate synthase [Cohnella lubricantis]MBB6676744.1 threonylcarbamoyl-AMP synthase [Cohnella lubricantis]MBP2117790.1 L-threonylcarbamoyladenylate synthase [Cohnella lubricantis]